MKVSIIVLSMLLLASEAFAQPEIGIAGGAGLFNNVTASSQAGSATAGFAPGFVVGLFVGAPVARSPQFFGEVRYEYMRSELRLSTSSQTAQFAGSAHAIHYDFLYQTNNRESRVRFFGVLGGGVKVFVASGTEAAYQPLSQYGYFTKTNSIKPMATAGLGVKFMLRPALFLRAEVRDFVTGFPTAVLTPAPGVTYGTLLHEIVPMVSLVFAK